MMASFFNQIRRISPKTKSKAGSTSAYKFLETEYSRSSLVKGSFNKFVTVPKYICQIEWLVSNTVEFYQFIELFCETIIDQCTCSSLDCGPGCDYTTLGLNKKTKVNAHQYMTTALGWIESQIDNEHLFPTKSDIPYEAKEVLPVLKTIHKHLYRILAHIYFCHFETVLHLEEERHLNSLFSHFLTFTLHFDLLDKKEWGPMKPFLIALEVIQLSSHIY